MVMRVAPIEYYIYRFTIDMNIAKKLSHSNYGSCVI